MHRILIGGTGSGCGKTTVTCAVLKALQMRGLSVSSFKCGPDYIDPMFHREIIGSASANLDGFFCSPQTIRQLLHQGSEGTDIAVIEGVMGYFDGMKTGSSAYDIARITDTPAVIVINARGMHESLGAVTEGFLHHRPDERIVGFIFNQLPASLTGSVREMCEAAGTHFVGYLPKHEAVLESRNLGLISAEEVPHLQEKILRLGELASSCIDLDLLLSLAVCAPADTGQLMSPAVGVIPDVGAAGPDGSTGRPVVAVAKDRAFCFRYPENLRLLEKLGCRIVYFSPLADEAVPEEADGLYLCGGYPELHAQTLSENVSMRESVKRSVEGGMPTIAECGGFLYLHRELRMEDGTIRPMAGVIDAAAFPGKKLHRFGYVTLTAHSDNLLCTAGEQIRAHEFHYWDSEDPGSLFEAQKQDGRSWYCGFGTENLYAGFPHLYFYAKPETAVRFTDRCRAYALRRGTRQNQVCKEGGADI